MPLPLANIAEQNLIEAINRGWGDKSAYTVTFQLQEEAAKVAIRADGVDPDKRQNIFQRIREEYTLSRSIGSRDLTTVARPV